MESFLITTKSFWNSPETEAFVVVGLSGYTVTTFLVKMFHMFSTNIPLTTGYLTCIVALVPGAVAATTLWARRSYAAEIKNLRRHLDLAQAKHSSVVDDLNKTAEKELSNASMVLQFTKKGLKDAQTALEQSRRIATAQLEFREALAKELVRTRAQRNWAASSVKHSLAALNEARRKASSQELVACEMQSQIKFKTNELRDMTHSLEKIKKELALANEFSQEAQDEIDEQDMMMDEHDRLMEKKEKIIQGLLDQIREHKMECRRMHSTIERPNLGVNSVGTKREKMDGDLTREVEYWRGVSQNWSTNNANTIHAMGSEIREVRGELAEVNAENERLTRDLKAMVKHAENFDKEREAMTQQIEQLEWDVVASGVVKEKKGSTEDVDMSDAKDEEENDEEEDPSWFPNEDNEDDGSSYELDEDSEEEEEEWFIHRPTTTKFCDGWCVEDATLVKDESKNSEPDERIQDIDALFKCEDEFEDNDLCDSLYSEAETLTNSGVEEEENELVLVAGWECDNHPTRQLKW